MHHEEGFSASVERSLQCQLPVQGGPERSHTAAFVGAAIAVRDGDLQDRVGRHVEGAATEVLHLPSAGTGGGPGLEVLGVAENGLPALLGVRAERHDTFEGARGVLEVPVAPQRRRPREVVARRHVRAGQLAQRADERPATLTPGEVAAVEEQIRVVREGVAPGGDEFRIRLEGLGTEDGDSESHGTVPAVRDDMHRVEILIPRQDLTQLLDAVASSVQDHHLDLPAALRLSAHVVDELLHVGGGGVDDDELASGGRGTSLGGGNGRGITERARGHATRRR